MLWREAEAGLTNLDRVKEAAGPRLQLERQRFRVDMMYAVERATDVEVQHPLVRATLHVPIGYP